MEPQALKIGFRVLSCGLFGELRENFSDLEKFTILVVNELFQIWSTADFGEKSEAL